MVAVAERGANWRWSCSRSQSWRQDRHLADQKRLVTTYAKLGIALNISSYSYAGLLTLCATF